MGSTPALRNSFKAREGEVGPELYSSEQVGGAKVVVGNGIHKRHSSLLRPRQYLGAPFLSTVVVVLDPSG